MLQEDYQVKKEEVKLYPPLPKNIYQAELLDITLTDATGKFSKEGDKNFVFQFTLLAGKDGTEDLRGRNIWVNFVPTSLYIGKNGKNALYQIVEAYLRRELNQEEEAKGLTGAFLNSFIGKQIKIFVDHKFSGNKIFNNVTSYMPAEEKLPSLTAEEKEKTRVKVKKENKPRVDDDSPQDEEEETEINIDNIPF